MKATAAGQYRKPGTGTLVFKHTISGTPEEIKAYEKAQGANLRHDEVTKAPLMFTTRAYPNKVNNVIVTRSGRHIIDSSELDRQQALVSQLGGNLGQALADRVAASIDFGGVAASAVDTTVDAGTLTEPEKK